MPPGNDCPGGWLLSGVREPKYLDSKRSLWLRGQKVLITPLDAPGWLKPDQCFLKSNLDFDQLADGSDFKNLASTAQLIAALRNPSLGYGADAAVAIHRRMVRPLLDITLLFLGLPLVVTRESRNVFIAIGMCIGIGTAFELVVAGFEYWGRDCALAAWAPLMIFVPAAVGLAESMWE